MITNKQEESLMSEWDEEVKAAAATFEGQVGDWTPNVVEDSVSIDFSKPVRGKYIAEFNDLVHREGDSEKGHWENLTVKFKITEDVEGDKSNNRIVSKTLWGGTSDWNEDPDLWLADYLSILITSGIGLPFNGRKPVPGDLPLILSHFDSVKGSKANLSCYPGKKKKNGDINQIVRVVNEFKLKGVPGDTDKAPSIPGM